MRLFKYAGYAAIPLAFLVHFWFARGRQSHLAVMTYAIFLATAPIAFRDGSLVAILRQLMFYWVPVAALAVLVRFGSLSALKRKPSTG